MSGTQKYVFALTRNRFEKKCVLSQLVCNNRILYTYIIMKRIALFLCAVIYAVTVCRADAIEDFINQPLLRQANIYVLVKESGSGKILAEHDSEKLAVPASITKLITTATALELLGGDFKFETYIETDGQTDSNGTLHGNLYIRGTGDPTLGSHRLGNMNFINTWIQQIRKYGITRIEGKVIADMSFFDAEAVNSGWIWEDIGNYYAPGICAISYMDNTLNFQLIGGAVGTQPILTKTIPYIPGLVVENHLRTSTTLYDEAYVHGVPFSNTRYLTGNIPANSGLFGLKGDIPNPGLLLAQHLTDRLRDAGIFVRDSADYTLKQGGERQRIFVHQSPELRNIIAEINFKSNNHYAEQLFRYLGSLAQVPSSTNSSIAVIESYWRNRIAYQTEFIQRDGSGLSPMNGIPAKVFVNLLDYMLNKSVHAEDFKNSLPVAGESGTLMSFLNGTSLHGKVHAKSGTTSRVKSYSGYIDANGKRYLFCVIVNNGGGKSKTKQHLIERFLLHVCSENK